MCKFDPLGKSILGIPDQVSCSHLLPRHEAGPMVDMQDSAFLKSDRRCFPEVCYRSQDQDTLSNKDIKFSKLARRNLCMLPR